METTIKIMVVISVVIAGYACYYMVKIIRVLEKNKDWNYHEIKKGIGMTKRARVALGLAYVLALVCLLILMRLNNM